MTKDGSYSLLTWAREMEIARIPRTRKILKKEASQVQSAAAESEDHVVSGATMARSGGVLAASYLSAVKAKRLAIEANGGPYLNFA